MPIKIKNYIRLMRPKQWIKNFFVFAAVVFSKNIFNIDCLFKAGLAFVCFCLISSCAYVLNDLVDVEKDRHHPRKQYRPIASGVVKQMEAIVILMILLGLATVLSFNVSWYFGIAVLAYFINNLLYSFALKHIVILDVMSIAIGFLLRVIGGALAIDVDISEWILLCTLLISLFLGLSKRRNELITLESSAGKHRKILEEYSSEFINNMLSIVTACTVMSYSLYTFSAYTNNYMMFTIPFVLYGIFRYQYIVYKKNEGGSPEEVILSDKPFLINIILWIIVSIVILYSIT